MRLGWSDPILSHEPCDSAYTHVNAFCQLVRLLIFCKPFGIFADIMLNQSQTSSQHTSYFCRKYQVIRVLLIK